MKVREKAQATFRKAKAKRQAAEKQERMSKKKVQFSKRRLISEIMFEAKVLNRHMGAAEVIAEKVADEVEIWAAKRTFITEGDIVRVASKKLEKYDKDLAYIYKNRGTII